MPRRERRQQTTQEKRRLRREYLRKISDARSTHAMAYAVASVALGPQLLEAIQPRLAELAHDEERTHVQFYNGRDILANLAHRYAGMTKDGVARRLYDLEKQIAPLVDYHLADALMMACGSNSTLAGLHALPTSLHRARAWTTDWSNDNNLGWSDDAIEEIAREVYEVALALRYRPHRAVSCTAETHDVIGGESRWIRPLARTGQSSTSTSPTTATPKTHRNSRPIDHPRAAKSGTGYVTSGVA